jgi:hypothetical protein
MSNKDASTVFHTAFNNMSKRYGLFDSTNSDLAKKTQLGVQTIRDHKKGKAKMDISTMEKILLNDIVSEEALDFFIEELKNLLIDYRKKNSLTNADLEDAALGGSQGKKN